MKKVLLIILLSIIAFTVGTCSKDIPLNASEITFSVNESACIGCNACFDVCPFTAIDMIGNKAVIDPSKCTGCGRCVTVCPVDAIK